MYKGFSLQASFKWHDILQEILKQYNNSKHRTIKIKPSEVM